MEPIIQKRTLVYDGAVAKVYRIDLKMPDGQTIARDLIHYIGAAVILPILADGSIVFIRNYRFAVNEHVLELPAGMIDPGESPQICAERELTEETGYSAGKLEKLGAFCTAPGSSDEIIHAFLATDLKAGSQALEGYEQIDVEIVPGGRVKQMVADGTIHDAKTISALTLCWLRHEAT